MMKVQSFHSGNLLPEGIIFLNNNPLLDEDCFRRMLNMEQKRSERLNKSIMFMLIDIAELLQCKKVSKTIKKLLNTLYSITRETDIKGWYDANRTIGIIYTEFDDNFIDIILNKLKVSVGEVLTPEHYSIINLSYVVFPQDRIANNKMVKLNAA